MINLRAFWALIFAKFSSGSDSLNILYFTLFLLLTLSLFCNPLYKTWPYKPRIKLAYVDQSCLLYTTNLSIKGCRNMYYIFGGFDSY